MPLTLGIRPLLTPIGAQAGRRIPILRHRLHHSARHGGLRSFRSRFWRSPGSSSAGAPSPRPPFTWRRPLAHLPPTYATPLRAIISLITLVPVFSFCSVHVANVHQIKGPSMRPTLNPDVTLPGYRSQSQTTPQGEAAQEDEITDDAAGVSYGFFRFVKHQLGISDRAGEDRKDASGLSLWNDAVLVNRWKPWTDLERGQVIMLKHPLRPDDLVVKRVVALPHDLVFPRKPKGVENVLKDEEGWMGDKEWHGERVGIRVPTGHIWVEGDSGKQSLDSNQYGAVSMGLVVGKVIYVVWPVGRWGVVGNYNFGKKRVVVAEDEAVREFERAVELG